VLGDTGQVTFVRVDLSQPGSAEELIAVAANRGGIDVLINNVGGATVHPGGFARITDDQWKASWDLNVMAVVRPTRAALPQIARRGGGSIVFVGSISAYLPGPETYNYCAAKAAIINIAKALSKELAPNNIRVNSVTPGAVSTRRWMEQGGLTTPEEVADLVIFLASDRAGNTTGSDYRIDGGYVTTL
jgi:NAD(P)-dependent dehydrogenase (short-subunit alcohol dehydrogenase family)